MPIHGEGHTFNIKTHIIKPIFMYAFNLWNIEGFFESFFKQAKSTNLGSWLLFVFPYFFVLTQENWVNFGYNILILLALENTSSRLTYRKIPLCMYLRILIKNIVSYFSVQEPYVPDEIENTNLPITIQEGLGHFHLSALHQ